MPTLTIDGKEITVKDGTTVFEAARQNKTEIPHFCYHPKLSIAGNCRMCLVNIEKMPKPAISCNTIATEGMVVHTQTDEVKALQKNVLEFILINHPIDCPVCDQAGECKLQEFYMDYSVGESEFEEDKVKKPKKVDLGPNVILDDERCILCSRCIRFCDEVSKSGELCFVNRGDRSALTTFPGKKLDNPYSLNTVDICPVGALTSKPFRFQKRVWFLKSVPSVCTGCSNGCNIYLDHHDGKVWRYKTRENEAVNECWTCDEGRLSYPFINEKRIIRPMMKSSLSPRGRGSGRGGEGHEFTTVAETLKLISDTLNNTKPEDLVLIGSAYESNENNAALKKLAEALGVSTVHYSAHEVDHPFSDDFMIKADKNPNRAGVEHLGFQEFSGGVKDKVVIALDRLGKSHLDKIKSEDPKLLVLLACNESDATQTADVVLPTASFAEQSGTFTNHQKRVQKFEKALEVKGQTLTATQWITNLAEALGHAGKIDAPDVLFANAFGIKYEDLGDSGKEV